MCRPIRTFINDYLESIVDKFAPCKISIFYLVSVAEQAGFNLMCLETWKTGFLATRHSWVHNESWTSTWEFLEEYIFFAFVKGCNCYRGLIITFVIALTV